MKRIVFWFFRIVPSIIMLQTLFFKFTAAPESVVIFSKLNLEPYGRIGTGIIELIASVLLLIPKKSFYGALLGIGTMLGAILSHIFILNIEVNQDHGSLFFMACTTFLCCTYVLITDAKNFLY
ncbi:DoxX family protein [Flavobacterium sp. U410]